jgi:hypothetical protein
MLNSAHAATPTHHPRLPHLAAIHAEVRQAHHLIERAGQAADQAVPPVARRVVRTATHTIAPAARPVVREVVRPTLHTVVRPALHTVVHPVARALVRSVVAPLVPPATAPVRHVVHVLRPAGTQPRAAHPAPARTSVTHRSVPTHPRRTLLAQSAITTPARPAQTAVTAVPASAQGPTATPSRRTVVPAFPAGWQPAAPLAPSGGSADSSTGSGNSSSALGTAQPHASFRAAFEGVQWWPTAPRSAVEARPSVFPD